jgi:hypothetical protein
MFSGGFFVCSKMTPLPLIKKIAVLSLFTIHGKEYSTIKILFIYEKPHLNSRYLGGNLHIYMHFTLFTFFRHTQSYRLSQQCNTESIF